MSDVCFRAAHELRELLSTRALSARELTEAFIAQYEKTHEKINALVTTRFDGAIDTAKSLDAYQAKHQTQQYMAGHRTLRGRCVGVASGSGF